MASYLTRFVQTPDPIMGPQGQTPIAPEGIPLQLQQIQQPPTPPPQQMMPQAPPTGMAVPPPSPAGTAMPQLPSTAGIEGAQENLQQAGEVTGWDRIPGKLGEIIRTFAGKQSRSERMREALGQMQAAESEYQRGLKKAEVEGKRQEKEEARDPNSAYNENLRESFRQMTNLSIPDSATAETFPILAKFAMAQQERQAGMEDFEAKQDILQQNRLDILKTKEGQKKRRGRGGGGVSAPTAEAEGLKQAVLAEMASRDIDPSPYRGLVDSLTGNSKKDTAKLEQLNRIIRGQEVKISVAGSEGLTATEMNKLDKLDTKFRQSGIASLRPEVRGAIRAVQKADQRTITLAMTLDNTMSNIGRALMGQSPSTEELNKARRLRQQFQHIANIELKKRSGAAVTEPEQRRFEQEMGSGAFARKSDLINSLKRLDRAITNDGKSISRGVSNKVLDYYFREVNPDFDRTTGKKPSTKVRKGGGKVTVSDGKETYRIDKKDLAAARKEGFKVVK